MGGCGGGNADGGHGSGDVGGGWIGGANDGGRMGGAGGGDGRIGGGGGGGHGGRVGGGGGGILQVTHFMPLGSLVIGVEISCAFMHEIETTIMSSSSRICFWNIWGIGYIFWMGWCTLMEGVV